MRPLTYATPKPMAPVAGKPVLHYCLESLAKHGVREVMLNLWAFPEQVVESCKDGSRWGLKLHYSTEKKLLGTAGAVKKCEDFLKDSPFLILSGDGMHDVDLSSFYRFHRKRKSVASMVVKRIDAKYPYGVTLPGKNGRIKGFLEKPSFGDFFSNTVNTGIYCFEPEVLKMMPKGFYDFGHDLWPKLFKKKKPIFAWEWKGFWTDVGDLDEYRRAQIAAMTGEVRCSLPGKRVRKGVWIGEGARIERGARIQGPCVIGAGAKIGAKAEIGPETVVGAGARVGADASLKKCILFDKTVVGAGASLVNCILGEKGSVKARAVIHNGVTLRIPNT
jgi:mannose-1-phosphate guanylyltransferase/phosphomannomutase